MTGAWSTPAAEEPGPDTLGSDALSPGISLPQQERGSGFGLGSRQLTADALRQPDGEAKQSPGVKKLAAVGEIGSDHDQRLDPEQGRAAHERADA